jgi:hypothetical protein
MTTERHHHTPDDVHEHDLGLQHDVDTLTAGPYPGDESNGPNVLTGSGIVRKDITSSFGAASGVADGVPLTLRFRVYDLSGDEVYATAGYESSLANLSGVSLDGDGIVGDGWSLQLATVTGSVAEGYVATLEVPI